jgi:hypothetical protein
MDLNLTNLQDLDYICQLAADYFEPRYGTAKETEWLNRISAYRRLIHGEIDRLKWNESDEQPLHTDPARDGLPTGIFVRAVSRDGKFHSVDISTLTKDALFTWLRSRGGNNPWAENTVALLLGYEVNNEH